MKDRILSLFILFSIPLVSGAQDFSYGAVRVADLTMPQYAPDTSASAVVLKEYGQAYISESDYNLIYKYHVRIKILNKNGLRQANIEIPLYKEDNTRAERIISIKASAFNIQHDRIHEEVLREEDIFTENHNKYYNVKKFAIPNVRTGSVIELTYTMTSPFLFNFRSWEFQSDIPKMESEYRATIPAVFVYNITLRGFLKLSRDESTIEKECWGNGDAVNGGFSADCSVMHLGMKNIPAFVEEDYMTARKNFLAAIHFELSEIRHKDGRVDRITKEWKDAEQELRQEFRFGVQLRRGRDIGQEVEKLVADEFDQLTKAKKVYDFIKGKYVWNGTYGKYSESGIKKAFDEGKGNVGDINLSLIAALRFAGLDADPVILSTRQNGTVMELYPVLSEFNYVIAKVNIGDKVYLADATDKHYPFGLLPERCLNGKGRLLGDRESTWIDLKPTTSSRTVTLLTLALEPDGMMRGTLHTTYSGYDAIRKRADILSHQSQDAYIKDLASSLQGIKITRYELANVNDPEKVIVRKLDVELEAFSNPETANFLFNPFLLDKWSANPFRSKERLYPVDFGVPLERVTVLTLQYPESYEIANVPEKVGLALPGGSGRFLLNVNNANNTFTLNNSLSIRRTLYSSSEYHYLRELFNRILQVQNAELIFRKKT